VVAAVIFAELFHDWQAAKMQQSDPFPHC
jgi:hypothetical protein